MRVRTRGSVITDLDGNAVADVVIDGDCVKVAEEIAAAVNAIDEVRVLAKSYRNAFYEGSTLTPIADEIEAILSKHIRN